MNSPPSDLVDNFTSSDAKLGLMNAWIYNK
jgi:hypothetical protein